MRAGAKRAATDERHQRTVALLYSVTSQQHRDMRIRLDDLTGRFDQCRVIVNRLKRGNHADDECIAAQSELLAHFLARSEIWFEAHRIDARRHDCMPLFGKFSATMQ